jgi:ribonuclease VapC
MVIDSSALIAILMDEPERRAFNEKIEADPVRLLSAANFVEAAVIIETRLGEAGGREFDLFLYRAGIQVAPVDAEQAEIARRALAQYGRGRHPASLNFGGCFAYALAKARGEPLLFKGGDFTLTDIAAG